MSKEPTKKDFDLLIEALDRVSASLRGPLPVDDEDDDYHTILKLGGTDCAVGVDYFLNHPKVGPVSAESRQLLKTLALNEGFMETKKRIKSTGLTKRQLSALRGGTTKRASLVKPFTYLLDVYNNTSGEEVVFLASNPLDESDTTVCEDNLKALRGYFGIKVGG